MKSYRRKILYSILIVGWFALILGLYYYRHKPFSPDLALAIVILAARITICLAILSLSAGLGVRLLSGSIRNASGYYSLTIGLGFGLLGTCFYLAMRFLGVTALLAWGSLIVLTVFLWRDMLAFWGFTGRSLRSLFPGGLLERGLGAIIIFLLTYGLLTVNAPALKFDALVYHLALPLNYILTESGSYISANMFWGMPQITESFYTWAMLLGGTATGAIMGWAISLVAFFSLLIFMAETLGSRPAWVGAGALFGGLTIVQAISWAYVEWTLILVGSACLAGLLAYFRDGLLRWTFICGLLCGVAFGVKYTGAAILLPVGFMILLKARKKAGFRIALSHSGSVFLGFIIMAGPWLIKNFISTGNPLYPFIFPSGAMTAERLALYQGVPVDIRWIDTFLLPLQATVVGIEGGRGFSASIGPLLLGLGVFAWLPVMRDERDSKDLIRVSRWAAVAGIFTWMVAARLSGLLSQTRLYSVFFPAFTILAGSGFRSLSQLKIPGIRLGRVVGSVVLFVVGLNLVQNSVIFFRSGAVDFLLGSLSRQAYLERNLGWYAPAMQAVVDLPPGSSTLMLWEPRGYYCLAVCDSDEVIDRWKVDYQKFGDISGILKAWRDEGYSHILLHEAGADFIRSDDVRYPQEAWTTLDRLLSTIPIEQEFGGVYTLYRLSP